MKEELKELQKDNELIRNQLNDIAFVNGMEGEELDEFWGRILNLIDNEIEQERFCNE